MKLKLNAPPKFTRFSTPGALPVSGTDGSPVDETGGDFGAGLIKGVSALCRGEALGHNIWCDGDMLAQCCDQINALEFGAKSRFTHPDMSNDGLGKGIARSKNARVSGDKVLTDKHFFQSSHSTPDGDLGGYVMSLAKEDPAAFGTSIVFERDAKAEQEFMAAHGAEWKEDEDGTIYLDRTGFRSPDPDNVNHYPHARIKELRAVDFVDDPAANPAGLFHRNAVAKEASQLAAFALGLPGAARPAITAFDLDPDRVAGFVSRFLQQHCLELVPKDQENPMPTAIPAKGAAEPALVVLTAAQNAQLTAALAAGKLAKAKSQCAADEDDEDDDDDNEPAEQGDDDDEDGDGMKGGKNKKQKQRTGQDYMDAFGKEQGAVWFAQGVKWLAAKKLHTEKLAADLKSELDKNAELTAALTAVRGEKAPLGFTSEQSPTEKAAAAAKGRFRNLGPGLAAFAASIVIPQPNGAPSASKN